jgi:3-hydroxymyristoyl/3-hydroxydecanoyl-(acyl carrier protein) dehydratase
MPECLIIEAMAQTAGILVGEAKGFKEKVVLAKISKAVFFDFVRPGDTIKLHAKMESIAPEAASTSGKVFRGEKLIAEINVTGRKRTYMITDKGRAAYLEELERLKACIADAEGEGM